MVIAFLHGAGTPWLAGCFFSHELSEHTRRDTGGLVMEGQWFTL